jgi:hypothetical protein
MAMLCLRKMICLREPYIDGKTPLTHHMCAGMRTVGVHFPHQNILKHLTVYGDELTEIVLEEGMLLGLQNVYLKDGVLVSKPW